MPPSPRMTKKDLVDALEFTLAAYALAMLSPALVAPREWERLVAKADPSEEALAQAPLRDEALRVAAIMRDDARRPALLEIARTSAMRALLVETHELVLTYTIATGQFEPYRKHPAFEFARLARLSLMARNGGAIEWPRDLASEVVAWRDRRVTAADGGTMLALTHAEALALHRDVAAFARDLA